ncbi:Gfo/Idh/MocA family protein [Sporosarcina ureilytica]|uniref:Dehydrogenase n=1 Tax=Sporosarcina ureilytica TaxID=298596 RepID=A0A1D8JI85_9BACL|nr:Gfo/Idh/MocA family oxidoreductase [Sporosarcina ureilytica]AOV08425.1 dehydrogenase [Sporosarcina ureilytica]
MHTTFAIVGTGIVGERIIQQLQQNEQAKIIAIFDENNVRLTEIANKYDLQATTSYEEVLALKPDWVYIGTPPASHAELSNQASEAGLNVLCEKPLAHDATDGLHMVEATGKSNTRTAMHFPLMYSPSVRHMMKLVRSGEIGSVVRIELNAHFQDWPRPWQQNPWIGSREQGGFVREVFPHYLQLMCRMFGELSIHHHQTTYPTDVTLAETSVLATGATENNIPFLLNGLSGIGQKENLTYIVYGTNGVLKLRNWSELSIARKNSAFEILTSFDSVRTLVDECIAASNEKESNLVPFEEGLEVQRLIDSLLE